MVRSDLGLRVVAWGSINVVIKIGRVFWVIFNS